MKPLSIILIIILMLLIDSLTALSKDNFFADSAGYLYYGIIQNSDAYSLLSNYKIDSNQAKYEIDTIRNLEIEFEYYLYFKPGQQSFIFIKKDTDSLFSKFNYTPQIRSNLKKNEDKNTLYFEHYNFTIVNNTKDTINFNFKFFNEQYHGHTVYSSTKAVKVAADEQNITEFLKYAVNDFSDTYKPDHFPKIWIFAQFMNPTKTEFRLQGYWMNLWDLGTNRKLQVNISCPSFTIKKDNGKYMFSYQFVTIPISLGLLLLSGGYDKLFPSKNDTTSLKKRGNGFLEFAGWFGVATLMPSILNVGIDYPLSYGEHYSALTFKLNAEWMLAADSLTQGYLEPKFGFRYIYNNYIGAEFQVGYRFWEKPELVSEEHTWYGVSLLVPFK